MLYLAGESPSLVFPGDRKPWICPMSHEPTWSLHPQLAQDAVSVGDLLLARVLLMNDANYPWLLLVPRRPDVSEIFDLGEVEQGQLVSEITLLARVLKDVTGCHKLNIAAIGNVVPQLHVHIVARRRGDAAWPRPVWGTVAARPYEPAERDRLIAAIQQEVAFG
jgi:diadenosine tetraphosphate (Ap4A) HIT family hydrolase